MGVETVTVLFTDLVGSTELLSRVGEAQADELRREHFGLLRTALTAQNGREVKNLGDGLMVVFDGVTSALDAAVAMQQALTARPEDAEPLAICVGVASGEAECEDGDYFGLPVVEAARLCAQADGGEILTTELVRMLARSRSTLELESVGALELKGLDEPVETYRVRWAPIAVPEERPPLPARIASSVSPTFVGREAERERLDAAWKAVTGGERRVMLLAGEPGIGKTTLAAQFASGVYDGGAVVVYGRCDEDLGVPYQPWIESLTQLVAHAPESVLSAHVADRGGHLARLVPELARRVSAEVPPSGDGETERYVLYGCVTDLLTRLSVDAPVLIVLDDLHWADRATVQLLRHLAMTDTLTGLGVLGTFRDSEVTTEHPLTELLAALHRENCGERIALRGLGDDELLALLEGIAGHGMDDAGVALRDAILAETAGNPFFSVEILRHLAESGAIYRDDTGRWVSDIDLRTAGLPISVREVVGRRLATLGPDTERVLALGAVIGRDFDLPLLAAVADVTEDDLVDVCDAAVAAAVLHTTDHPDRYTFAHALIEHTLYDGLSPARRSRAHRALAVALEAAPDADRRAGELAYHWGQAVQPTDTDKAVHYAKLAGARALDQLAPDDAMRWYGQALEHLDRDRGADAQERIEILIGLGQAQRQSGVADYRETLLEAAQLADSIDAVDLLVQATLANNRGMLSAFGQVDTARLAAIDRALERIDPAHTPERAQLLALGCIERTYDGDFDTRFTLAEEAVAAARRAGDPDTLVTTVVFCCDGIMSPRTAALRRSWLEEANQLDDRITDPAARYLLHNCWRFSAIEWGERDVIRHHDAIANEIVARVPQASLRWNNAFHQVWQKELWGDLARAEELAEAAFALGTETAQPDALGIFGMQLMNIRSHQGRLDELIPLIEQMVSDTPAQPGYRAVLALALARSGREAETISLLDAERAHGFEMPIDYGWSVAHAEWAEAAVLVGHRETAAAVRERLVPFHDMLVSFSIGAQAAIAHYLGMIDHLLGRHDDAHRWFGEAMALHQRFESPLLVAQTNAAWAGLLADRGTGNDHERARAMATDALTAATSGGYGYIERDARSVLERIT